MTIENSSRNKHEFGGVTDAVAALGVFVLGISAVLDVPHKSLTANMLMGAVASGVYVVEIFRMANQPPPQSE